MPSALRTALVGRDTSKVTNPLMRTCTKPTAGTGTFFQCRWPLREPLAPPSIDTRSQARSGFGCKLRRAALRVEREWTVGSQGLSGVGQSRDTWRSGNSEWRSRAD